MFIKDLRVINRNLSDIVLVDNAVYSFGFQLDNAVPILYFYDNKDDVELLELVPYLKRLANVKYTNSFRLLNCMYYHKGMYEKSIDKCSS